MNAYMHPDTAKALLQQSRDFTEKKRAERRQAEEFAVALDGFKRCGWTGESAEEMAHFQVYGTWK